MLTRADHPKVSQRELHLTQLQRQRNTVSNAMDNFNCLSTIRISIEIISQDQLNAERKLDETLFKAGIEMPDTGIIQYDVRMPLTDPGIVQFEKEIAELCQEFNNTKWY